MPKYYNKFKLLFIFLLAFVLRAFLLGEFPIGMTHDELNYVIAAKSLFYTGNFASGTAPAVLPTQMSFSTVTVVEVPSIILSIFIGALNLNLFTARFVGALFSSFSVVLLYLLVKEITKKETMSIATALIAVINPWSFLMGRTVFEVNFYIFFFLLGFLIMLRNIGWKIFYSAPFFLLGFLSYTGGQITFYLFILGVLVANLASIKKRGPVLKPYILFTILFTVIFAGYILSVKNNQSGATRGAELYLPSSQQVSNQVGEERQLSVPSKINNLFINKATIYTRGFLEKYVDAFSTSTLFVRGEFRAAFSFQKHGTFYVIDAIFIILGTAVLYSINKRVWWLFMFVILVSPITSGISIVEHSYAQRSGLMYPFLIILAGVGLGGFIQLIKNKLTRKLVILLSIGVYLVFFINLLHLFFYRFPVYASDGWFFQDRVIAKYINLSLGDENIEKVLVSTFEPKIIFQEYLFYSGLYNKHEDVKLVNSNLNNKTFKYANVEFIQGCPRESEINDKTVWIYDSSMNCKTEEPKLRITRYRDVYEQYLIVGDRECNKYTLNNYVFADAYKNFEVERQSSQDFCQSWITSIKNNLK